MEITPRTISTPKGDLILRAAVPDDADLYGPLRLLALQTSPTAFGMSYEEQAAMPPDHWRIRLAANNMTVVLDTGSDLVGMAVLVQEQGAKVRHHANIYSVFVHPDWRGMGLAEALIRTLLTAAYASSTIRFVDLSVNTTNEVAYRLYERLGFRVYGTLPEALFVDGTYYDEYLMTIQIRS